jgi:hypothetical protein
MKRPFLASVTALATVALAAVATTTASAETLELGVDTTAPLVAPVCPAGVSANNCKIVLTQVTVLASVRDGIPYPTTVTKPGVVVAFTVGVSSLSTDAGTAAKYVKSLDATYGGPAQAQLTVLRPVGKRSNHRYVVAAQSPAFDLESYLGEVVQFPLIAPLPVVPGEQLGLTVPTWAPVLSFALTPANKFGYRQSRHYKSNAATQCTNTPVGFAQGELGDTAEYQCNYTGTRVEYSATEITTPSPGITTPSPS